MTGWCWLTDATGRSWRHQVLIAWRSRVTEAWGRRWAVAVSSRITIARFSSTRWTSPKEASKRAKNLWPLFIIWCVTMFFHSRVICGTRNEFSRQKIPYFIAKVLAIWLRQVVCSIRLVFQSGLRMRGFFKSVRVRVFQQLAHRVTHRIQRFWLLTRLRYAFSTLPTVSFF